MENGEVAAKQETGTKRKTHFQFNSLKNFYLGIIILLPLKKLLFSTPFFFFFSFPSNFLFIVVIGESSDVVALRSYCLII